VSLGPSKGQRKDDCVSRSGQNTRRFGPDRLPDDSLRSGVCCRPGGFAREQSTRIKLQLWWTPERLLRNGLARTNCRANAAGGGQAHCGTCCLLHCHGVCCHSPVVDAARWVEVRTGGYKRKRLIGRSKQSIRGRPGVVQFRQTNRRKRTRDELSVLKLVATSER
jgi:hypothetical protein